MQIVHRKPTLSSLQS